MTISGEIFSDRLLANSASNTNVAYTTPVGLQYTAGNEQRYFWKYTCAMSIAAGVPGFDLLIASTGATFYGTIIVSSVATGLVVAGANAIVSPLNVVGAGLGGDSWIITAEGFSATGNLSFQFRQAALDAVNAVTILANSLLFITKLS